jgi:DNA mismatch repair ATPase MutS
LETAVFPHHALDTYLPKLIRAGERVAICDQLTMPKQQNQEDTEEASQQEVKEVVARQEEQRTSMHR